MKFGSFKKGSAINNMPGAGLSISSKLSNPARYQNPPRKKWVFSMAVIANRDFHALFGLPLKQTAQREPQGAPLAGLSD
jgi:hypothetical protein